MSLEKGRDGAEVGGVSAQGHPCVGALQGRHMGGQSSEVSLPSANINLLTLTPVFRHPAWGGHQLTVISVSLIR